ncbi:MAG: nitrate reductase associated protein [Phormidesmis sp.]
MSPSFFEFEQDFVGNLRCIPMTVRHSLDTCGVKLKLEHWNQFTQAERQDLVNWPCSTNSEAQTYRDKLQVLITEKMGQPAKTLEVSENPPWQSQSEIPEQVQQKFQAQSVPLSLDQWTALSELQRFALIKLSRPSHENNNFLPALKEFGLVQ